MCFRLILCTILLVSVTIILSSSSSEHRLRRRSHSWKACEPFILPSNAEWIRRWYNKRCKGLFVCCEGYELVVKTVCNKRGRWRVKTFCVPRRTTRKTTTSSTTASSTIASSTTASSTTASSTTSPTSPTTTPQTTPTTTNEPECDTNPTVENGIITGDISIEVGSVVQFNCSSGFTLNGRVGTLTCNDNGNFVQSLFCDDCRMQDERVSSTFFDDEVTASDESECNQLCNDEPDCISSEFTAPSTCKFDFTIQSDIVVPGSVESCRQSCYDNSKCTAFRAPTIAAQDVPVFCSLFTRKPLSFASQEGELILSSCI